MAYGFKIKDSNGNVTISSENTTALLQEFISKTTTGSGSKTFSNINGDSAYAIGIPTYNGDGGISIFGGVGYGIATSTVNGDPKVSWDISCGSVGSLFGDCADWDEYNIFVFIK